MCFHNKFRDEFGNSDLPGEVPNFSNILGSQVEGANVAEKQNKEAKSLLRKSEQ
ncbi:MAG: hypothetical protein QW091_02725 [Candidatus Micrarchaeaceae archaeon]